MIVLIKISLLACLALIWLQDIKERRVYWFLFPIAAILFGLLHILEIGHVQFLINLSVNILFVGIVLFVLYSYANIKMKMKFTKTFGLGDILMFFALCFSYATISFVTIFVFSILFALVLHIALKKQMKAKTAPLAGYMSLFFAFSLIGAWMAVIDNPYFI